MFRLSRGSVNAGGINESWQPISGIGGIGLGFSQAGFEIAWAIENNHACCDTYRANFGDTLLIEQAVRKVDAGTLSPVDEIAAGFPR